jgi:hypothetical protein
MTGSRTNPDILPLFGPGVPGLPELLIAFVVLGLYLVIPVLLIVAVYDFLDGKRAYEERISALERRVRELEGSDSHGIRARWLPSTGEDSVGRVHESRVEHECDAVHRFRSETGGSQS